MELAGSKSFRRFWLGFLSSPAVVPSYDWGSFGANRSGLPANWRALDPQKSGSEAIRSMPSKYFVLDVESRVMVLPQLAVVLTAQPRAVLDLAGGCCRPPPPLRFRSLGKRGVIDESPRRLLDNVANDTVEHEWLFLACHSHAASYYHSLGEAAPKLLWGLQLLRSNPQISVLLHSQLVAQIIGIMGLANRAVFDFVGFARRITFPPAARLDQRLMGAMRRELFRAKRGARVPPRGVVPAVKSVLVVRRSATAGKGGRAMLNHDELMFTLRQVLLPGTVQLAEWPPGGTSLRQAMEAWSVADAVIAPHGAGLTNVIFMAPGSIVVEIIARGQTGRVYGTLSNMMGHRYHSCYYTRNGHGTANLSLPAPLRSRFFHPSFTMFRLEMDFLLGECIPRSLLQALHDSVLPPPKPAQLRPAPKKTDRLRKLAKSKGGEGHRAIG